GEEGDYARHSTGGAGRSSRKKLKLHETAPPAAEPVFWEKPGFFSLKSPTNREHEPLDAWLRANYVLPHLSPSYSLELPHEPIVLQEPAAPVRHFQPVATTKWQEVQTRGAFPTRSRSAGSPYHSKREQTASHRSRRLGRHRRQQSRHRRHPGPR